tara:strand:+ start:1325 stop:1936 length:612 start_codon:yes stop_codon:yes gene_type:complete
MKITKKTKSKEKIMEYKIINVMGNASWVKDSLGSFSHHIIYEILGSVGKSLGRFSYCCEYNIEGNVLGEGAYKSSFSSYHIGGNVSSKFAIASLECEFIIKGNVGKQCGFNSEQSLFKIYGSIEDYLGDYAKECKFHILKPHEHLKLGREINNCTFYTYDKKTYDSLSKQIKEMNENQNREFLDKTEYLESRVLRVFQSHQNE